MLHDAECVRGGLFSLVAAGVAGCCCGPQLPPCVGCNSAGYNSPVSAISVALELLTNGQALPALMSFVGSYSPFVFQNKNVCRWIDPTVKIADSPSSNGLGYYRWTVRGILCQPQISGSSLGGYGLFPLDTSQFNGWAFFLNDGTFGGASAEFAGAIVGANQCLAVPQGQYGSITPPSYQYGVVS